MANLTEVEQYDAGVYQIETTDFVAGGADGVTNTPAKNLANRTKWLKAKIDGFLSGAIKAKKAETADKLISPRKINGVNFDGSADITISDNTKEPAFDVLQAPKGGTGRTDGLASTFPKNFALGFQLGNQDWTSQLVSIPNGVSYSEADRGLNISSGVLVRLNNRTAIDPLATYKVVVRVKRLSGGGVIYIGADSLNGNFESIHTDGTGFYNYFGALGAAIAIGATQTFTGTISGYNTPSEANHHKFDPGAKYFNLVFIYDCSVSGNNGNIIIESVELIKVTVPFASQEEVNAGTVTDKVVSPRALAGNKNASRYISPLFDVTYATEYAITHNLGTKDVRITVYAEIVADPVNCSIGDRFEVGNMVISYDNSILTMGVVKKITDINTIKIRTSKAEGGGLGYVISADQSDNNYMNWTNATTNNKSRLIVIVEKI